MERSASIHTVLGHQDRIDRGIDSAGAPIAGDKLPAAGSAQIIADLLHRMRDGDRNAAAEFLHRYGTRIRRRIRGKLGPNIRRLFDSMDILSTMTRKLDLYVMSGSFKVTNEEHLWSLLMRMADHALIHKARVFRQLQSVEGEDGPFARQLAQRLRHVRTADEDAVEIEIDCCLRVLPDDVDRRILSLWLSGETHGEIAEQVDLKVSNVRKRWERIKVQLKDRLQP